MSESNLWDQQLVDKYNTNGPRYTSYPTAMSFDDSFGATELLKSLKGIDDNGFLSIYVHIPFCHNICYYCACNKVITKDKTKADQYLDYLLREAELYASNLGRQKVSQLHFGGGTPTFLSHEQLEHLLAALRRIFNFAADAECSIEIDPRTLDQQTIPLLQRIGFNRLSIGVQDFNREVQIAVNREQSSAAIQAQLIQARGCGFESISMDLIYGLPFQSLSSFEQTLDRVIQLAPDRLSLFNYAHLPHRFKAQRRINSDALPSATTKMAILKRAIERLTESGYIYIGMDHFALPHDELAQAQITGKLQRNFQGYTTQPDCELIGLGVSAISQTGATYSQNERTLDAYYQRLDDQKLPVWRGCQLDWDDMIRRFVIMQLICHFCLSFSELKSRYNVEFHDYFDAELEQLAMFEADGLIVMNAEGISVNRVGRLLIRNICMTFDRGLQELAQLRNFSQVI